MDEVQALNKSTGRVIPTIIQPTFQIFIPHLVQNKYAIKSINSKTEWYGTHPRQTLDVYTPENSSMSPTNPAPILVFFHGGGFIHGDKISPNAPEALVYANVGAFNLCCWMYTTVEAWSWERPDEEVVDRSRCPWDDSTRRASHADKRKALQRQVLRGEIDEGLSGPPDRERIRVLAERLLALAV